ncbi:MAG TPA: hypothetical protein VLB50_02270 [Ignavibacteriaceae bacterium]|nr:hypothetical protein [Ignavibacteriaceae bacterium]
MIKSRLILILIFFFPYQWNSAQIKINFHSTENVKAFADYLFCEKDYLRAYNEYSSYLKQSYNDSVEFKSALALQRIDSFDDALRQFNHISIDSKLYTYARREYFRTMFLAKDYAGLGNISMTGDSTQPDYSFLLRLQRISLLLSGKKMQAEENFISVFPPSEKVYIKKFYEWNANTPYKSPLLAGIMSAIIPGSGKVYTENYTDGLFAALLTGVFGYIAFSDFKADHDVRGWIFTGVSAFFYAGNIYGTIASAQIYNAKIKFNYETGIQDFLNTFDYLVGVYNFCR